MKRIITILTTLPLILMAQQPQGEAILKQIDANMSARTIVMTSTMIIHGRRSSRELTSKSWIQGEEKSFTEFLSPPREAGTKMLKLENQLWTYSPQTDRIIRIAGHMLRQSLMGSDLSYEDMMEDAKLTKNYTAQVIGEDSTEARDCWVVHLNAVADEVAYQSRKLWVDKERMIVLKEERYAKGGKLLKTTLMKSVMRQQGRWYPKIVIYRDMLSTGKGTEFRIESVEFNVDIPDYIFSKASLRR